MSLSPDLAIRVNQVSKMFKVYHRPVDLVVELVTGKARHQEFWALKDVSFDVARSDIVGILGTNGAGKSTLLKLITSNLDITNGDIQRNGSVAAILELGSGFRPEYSGRENLYMGAMVMGMSQKEIESKIEGIIDFSGIRPFIDQPFKTYSSGMQARLTFSLAVSREADILILDEALAAGDAIFANKSLMRIREICESDTTVLFVSHSTDMVRRFCNQAIWIEHGKVVMQGPADVVTKAYDRYVYEQSEPYLRSNTPSATMIVNELRGTLPDPEFFKYGSKEVIISDFKCCGVDGHPRSTFETGEHLEIRIYHKGKLANPDEILQVGCQIYSGKGDVLFTASTRVDCEQPFEVAEEGFYSVILSPLLLGPGDYLLSPALYAWRGQESRWLDFHDRLYHLRVHNPNRPGMVYLVEHPVNWHYSASPSQQNSTTPPSDNTEESLVPSEQV